jgi:hypothetical protein
MEFNAYYHSLENGEYLRQVVAACGLGQVKHFQELPDLEGENGADVVIVEYQDNNPQLDQWIAQAAGQPGCSEIFLLVEEASPALIWKSLKLGARELFSRAIPPEDFRDALMRVQLRHARLWQAHSEAGPLS